jgi:putative regulator of septum formation
MWRLLVGVIGLAGATVGLLGCSGADGPSGLAVTELPVGTCFDQPVAAEQIDVVDPVPCDQPHTYEVFATFDLPLPAGAPYPGADNVDAAASAGCADKADPATTERYDTFSLAPTEKGWDKDDRTVTCAAFLRSGEKATGPLAVAG